MDYPDPSRLELAAPQDDVKLLTHEFPGHFLPQRWRQ
jgi:hypothetical protein